MTEKAVKIKKLNLKIADESHKILKKSATDKDVGLIKLAEKLLEEAIYEKLKIKNN